MKFISCILLIRSIQVYEIGNWRISANKIDKKFNQKLWER